MSQQLEESPEDIDLDLIQSELVETIGKDQLEEKLARMKTKSESRERQTSGTSGTISPNKSGSGVNLNSSQENVRKRSALSRQASEAAKDEKPKNGGAANIRNTNEKQVIDNFQFCQLHSFKELKVSL